MKTCSKCHEQKNTAKFQKRKESKDGLRSQCNSCVNERRMKNKDHHYAKAKIWYENNKEKRLEKAREWNKKNEAHVRQKARDRYIEKKEDINSYNKQWYSNNKEHQRLWSKIHREKNKIAIAAKSKEYKSNNKDKTLALSAKRRSTQLNATPSWYEHDFVSFIYSKALSIRRSGVNVHVDHIVPLISDIVCGLHCVDNLQILPAIKNLEKGNRFYIT